MAQPITNGDVSGKRRHTRRRSNRIPPDTVMWMLFFGLALPLGIHAGWFQSPHHMNAAGEHVLLGLALMFGVLGTILLGVARIPIYFQKHHHSFRPRELPHHYRPIFWVAYVLIVVGLATLVTLLLAQHWPASV